MATSAVLMAEMQYLRVKSANFVEQETPLILMVSKNFWQSARFNLNGQLII